MKKILSVVFLTFLFFSLNVGHVYSWHFTIVILFDPSDCQGSGISGVTYSDDDTRYYCTYSVDTINNTARIDEVRHAPGTYQYPMDYLHNCKINPTVTQNGKTYVVEEIGEYAFFKVRTFDFNTIELPNTLKKIGVCAFSGMNIKRLIIPKGVEEIGLYSFSRANIDYLYIPNTIKTNGQFPFSNCKGNLVINCENLNIENFQRQGDGTYRQDFTSPLRSNLFNSITLTSDKECYVPDFLFNDYIDNHYYNVQDSISNLFNGQMQTVNYNIANCKGKYSTKIILTDSIVGSKSGFGSAIIDFSNISFPNTYKILGGFGFSYLPETIKIPNSVEIIAKLAFSGYDSFGNLEVIFNDKLHTIEDYAFEGRSLCNLKLPESLRHIGKQAFNYYNCDTLIIPDNVEYIGRYAFGYVDKVLMLGKNVRVLEEGFASFSWFNPVKIIVNNPVPPTLVNGENNYTFGSQYEVGELIVPKGSLEAYKKAEVWKNFFNIREEGETSDIIGFSNESKDNAPIYNLHGVRMQNTDNLPAGVYIKNGKKYMVR